MGRITSAQMSIVPSADYRSNATSTEIPVMFFILNSCGTTEDLEQRQILSKIKLSMERGITIPDYKAWHVSLNSVVLACMPGHRSVGQDGELRN